MGCCGFPFFPMFMPFACGIPFFFPVVPFFPGGCGPGFGLGFGGGGCCLA